MDELLIKKLIFISVFGAINERKIREVRMNLEKLTPVGPQDKTLEGSVNELYKN